MLYAEILYNGFDVGERKISDLKTFIGWNKPNKSPPLKKKIDFVWKILSFEILWSPKIICHPHWSFFWGLKFSLGRFEPWSAFKSRKYLVDYYSVGSWPAWLRFYQHLLPATHNHPRLDTIRGSPSWVTTHTIFKEFQKMILHMFGQYRFRAFLSWGHIGCHYPF